VEKYLKSEDQDRRSSPGRATGEGGLKDSSDACSREETPTEGLPLKGEKRAGFEKHQHSDEGQIAKAAPGGGGIGSRSASFDGKNPPWGGGGVNEHHDPP